MENKESKIYVNGFINFDLMNKKDYSIMIRNLKQIIKNYYIDKERKNANLKNFIKCTQFD